MGHLSTLFVDHFACGRRENQTRVSPEAVTLRFSPPLDETTGVSLLIRTRRSRRCIYLLGRQTLLLRPTSTSTALTAFKWLKRLMNTITDQLLPTLHRMSLFAPTVPWDHDSQETAVKRAVALEYGVSPEKLIHMFRACVSRRELTNLERLAHPPRNRRPV